jgi:hypothetical protein
VGFRLALSNNSRQRWNALDIFRIGAADDILRLFAYTHGTEFTVPEIGDATGITHSTVWRAVDFSTLPVPS